MTMASVRNFYMKALINFAAAVSFLSFSQNVSAQESAGNDNAALQVKYMDGDNETLVFNIKYDNKSGKSFKVLVLDESSGEALFQDNYSAKDFEKKLKIPRLTDTDYVTFLIRSAKKNILLSYKVKVTTKVSG